MAPTPTPTPKKTNSTEPTHYSGLLSTRRKPELLEICQAMGIDLPEGLSTVKYDVERLIEDRLSADKSTRHDERFSGLWDSIGVSSESEGEDDSEYIGNVNGKINALSSGGKAVASNLSKRASKLYDDISTDVTGSPTLQSVKAKSRESRKQIQEEAEQAGQLVVRRTSSAMSLAQDRAPSLGTIRHKSVETLKWAAYKTEDTLVSVQESHWASGWTLTVFLLFLEITYYVSKSLPWKLFYHGPHKWLLPFPETPTYTFYHPQIDVMFTRAFLRPFGSYLFVTIALPWILSGLLTFGGGGHGESSAEGNEEVRTHSRSNSKSSPSKRSSSSSVNGRRRLTNGNETGSRPAHRRLKGPSPVVFSILRLSIWVLIVFIFNSSGGSLYGDGSGGAWWSSIGSAATETAGSSVGWSLDNVHGYPSLSILGTIVAGAFAAWDELQTVVRGR